MGSIVKGSWLEPDAKVNAGMATDPVKNPVHYVAGPMECIRIIEALVDGMPAATAYRLGNVVKYLRRHRTKGKPIEDLRKAIRYIEMEIESYGEPAPK